MNWLLRFLLGLPVRKQDLKELKKALPELFKENTDTFKVNLRRNSYILNVLFDHPESDIFFKELKDWIKKVDEDQSTENSCSRKNCPYRTEEESIDESNDTPLLFNLIAAGMPNRKVPKAEFFALVKKTHSNTNKIKEVIVTDPYIYSDVGESGITGGYDCLIEYLEILGLNNNDSFILRVNPSPRNFTEQSRTIFQRVLSKKIKNIKHEHFSSKYTFHDRLYLIKDGNGKLKGVFGPSLNGLTTNSIVLLGELESNTIKRLEEVFG